MGTCAKEESIIVIIIITIITFTTVGKSTIAGIKIPTKNV
jgi:hypothetical protein